MKTPKFEARYSTKQWKHDLIKISPEADKKLTWSVKIDDYKLNSANYKRTP